eukprot:3305888-Alexandrium_andersonii.AAC.1
MARPYGSIVLLWLLLSSLVLPSLAALPRVVCGVTSFWEQGAVRIGEAANPGPRESGAPCTPPG